MIKLLVFSDSHGNPAAMQQAIRKHRDAEYVLFLGDGLSDAEALSLSGECPPLLGVIGNCDSFTSPYGLLRRTEEAINIEGKRLLLLHGHTAGVKSGVGGLISAARRASADIVLFGHTHLPKEEYIGEEEGGPLWLFNPGSIGKPYDGPKSYGLLTISEGGILLSHGRIE